MSQDLQTELDKTQYVVRVLMKRGVDLERALRVLVDSLEIDGAEITLSDALSQAQSVLAQEEHPHG